MPDAPPPPYGRSATLYDGLYAPKKAYRREMGVLLRILRGEGAPLRGTWLEAACGTGLHLRLLPPSFRAEGVDLSSAMLAVARRRLPGVPFHEGDLRTFSLGRRFDVVSCLFSGIGYQRTLVDLRAAIENLARHVAPGGTLLIEPWFTPTAFRAGTVHLDVVDGKTRRDLHQVRMLVTRRRGRLSILDAHHLVGTPSGVEHFVERHEMGLFTKTETLDALRRAGLSARYDATGLADRGLYVARAPTARRPPPATTGPPRRGRG